MVVVNEAIGITLVVVGAIVISFEFIHPGAILLIPGSILLAAGLLYLFLPDVLLGSYEGALVVVVVALGAGLAEIPYYRWVAPRHPPISTTVSSLVGAEGVVTVAVVPNTLQGKVRIRSEIWSARAPRPIPAGTPVRVVSGAGVSLEVEPISVATEGRSTEAKGDSPT